MNIIRARKCVELSKAIYNFNDFELLEGFQLIKTYSVRNHQYGLAFTDGTLYVVVRGTEPYELQDILTDINIRPAKFPELSGAKVHEGFKDASKQIFAEFSKLIFQNTKFCGWDLTTIVFTGHSLGSAVSTLLSVLTEYHFKENQYKIENYTFGSPKVFTEEAIEPLSTYDFKHYRFVNNNDVVPKLPINDFVWEHSGELYYIDRKQRIKHKSEIGFWERFLDGIIGRFKGLGDGLPDGLADHAINSYMKALYKGINK